ncbi:MAG: hypothetical protein PHS49_02190 [Candidatus Gracilibacteria bacterium]|nr:hypothetical protein [Candidatus Gracilibacteria bacterium]
MQKTKLIASILLGVFMFSMTSISAFASHDGKYKKKNEVYVQQCSDIPDLKGELATAQAALPNAQVALDAAKDAYDNAKKWNKKQLKLQLKAAQQLVWDLEGEISWINKQLKKLDKFCYGQGYANGNKNHGKAWWKNWFNKYWKVNAN